MIKVALFRHSLILKRRLAEKEEQESIYMSVLESSSQWTVYWRHSSSLRKNFGASALSSGVQSTSDDCDRQSSP